MAKSELSSLLPEFVDESGKFSFPTQAPAVDRSEGFIAADQQNLAENPPPAEPRSKLAQRATEAAAVVGGGAAGAGLNYRQGMFGPTPDLKYQYSMPGAGGSPVSQFDLSMPAGQNVEDARRKLQAEIAQWQAQGGMRDVEASRLRGGYERSAAEVPSAVAAREAALDRLTATNALRVPPEVPVVASPAPVGTDVVNRIQSAETSRTQPVSSTSRMFGQHELEAQAKYWRDLGVRTVDDLHKMGIVNKSLEEYMAGKGMFVPTPEGRVLVRPQTLMETPVASPEARAAQLAEQQVTRQAEDSAARARAHAEMIRARELEAAKKGFSTASSVANAAQKSSQTGLDKYLNFMGQRGLESEKLAPNVQLAQDALVQARGQMPSALGKASNVAQRALPILGGAVAGMGAGELGTEAFERSQRGDPIGATIAGAGAAASGYGAIPTLPSKFAAGAGALGSVGALMLYDKYGPSIIPWLEKKGWIPKDWNPESHSVMGR